MKRPCSLSNRRISLRPSSSKNADRRVRIADADHRVEIVHRGLPWLAGDRSVAAAAPVRDGGQLSVLPPGRSGHRLAPGAGVAAGVSNCPGAARRCCRRGVPGASFTAAPTPSSRHRHRPTARRYCRPRAGPSIVRRQFQRLGDIGLRARQIVHPARQRRRQQPSERILGASLPARHRYRRAPRRGARPRQARARGRATPRPCPAPPASRAPSAVLSAA